ncbi:MAG: serine/threonine-protein kinase [bacterium]
MTNIPFKSQVSAATPGVQKAKTKFRVFSSPPRQVPAQPGAVPPAKIMSKTPLKPVSPVLPPPTNKGLKLFPSKKIRNPDLDILSFSSNRYQIVNVIHEGGFGTVFKVLDKMLKMDVAIKLLKSDISRNPEAITQLKTEAAMSMKLSHEHIVRIHNIESEKGRFFIVMEYVDGHSLREIIDKMGALSLPAVFDITHACTEALTYAHKLGVLHRDIKPENMMINSRMRLKLVDFGLAIKMSRGRETSDFIEGSPGYMSPEQLHGLPLDAKTDVFSLAAVVCELMTGKRAFPGTARLKHMYDNEPVGIENLPPGVAQVIQCGLSRDAASRYETPAQFFEALGQVIGPLIS